MEMHVMFAGLDVSEQLTFSLKFGRSFSLTESCNR